MTIENATVLIPCTEPLCDDYGTGHEMFDQIEEAPMHSHEFGGEPPLWVELVKFDAPWKLVFSYRGEEADPETAERIAAVIVAAAAKCRELNAN